jgi:hypothetical protein
MVLRLLFLVRLLPMRAAAAVAQTTKHRGNQRQRGLGVLAVAVPVGSILFPHMLRRELLEHQTQAVAVAVPQTGQQVATAAPVS